MEFGFFSVSSVKYKILMLRIFPAEIIITCTYANFFYIWKLALYELENPIVFIDSIDKAEFETLSTLAVEKYLDNLWQNHPRFKPRTSEQGWLFMEQWLDPTVHHIRER